MIKTLSMSTTGLKFADNNTPIYLTAENNGIIFTEQCSNNIKEGSL